MYSNNAIIPITRITNLMKTTIQFFLRTTTTGLGDLATHASWFVSNTQLTLIVTSTHLYLPEFATSKVALCNIAVVLSLMATDLTYSW